MLRCLAALNGTKRFELLEVKAGSVMHRSRKLITLSAEDVRPPPGWAESSKLVLALEGVADVLDTGQREAVQGISDRLQSVAALDVCR